MTSTQADLDDLDPNLLAALLAALKDHPVAKTLTDEDRLEICHESIGKGTYSNASWLDHKAQELMDRSLAPKNTFKELAIPKKTEINSKQDLLDVLAQHSLWQKSVLDPLKEIVGGRADLSNAVLNNYDLEGLDLRGVNLENATLSECSLNGTNLATCNLKGATFSSSSLRKANLKRANLSGASLTDCEIEGANFAKAELSRVDWDGTDKDRAIFD